MMKKSYYKPQIAFECFMLSTSIAGDCGIKTDLHAQYSCGLDFGGEMIFTESISGCLTSIPDGGLEGKDENGNMNPICYHSPIDTSRLFGS